MPPLIRFIFFLQIPSLSTEIEITSLPRFMVLNDIKHILIVYYINK